MSRIPLPPKIKTARSWWSPRVAVVCLLLALGYLVFVSDFLSLLFSLLVAAAIYAVVEID